MEKQCGTRAEVVKVTNVENQDYITINTLSYLAKNF